MRSLEWDIWSSLAVVEKVAGPKGPNAGTISSMSRPGPAKTEMSFEDLKFIPSESDLKFEYILSVKCQIISCNISCFACRSKTNCNL